MRGPQRLDAWGRWHVTRTSGNFPTMLFFQRETWYVFRRRLPRKSVCDLSSRWIPIGNELLSARVCVSILRIGFWRILKIEQFRKTPGRDKYNWSWDQTKLFVIKWPKESKRHGFSQVKWMRQSPPQRGAIRCLNRGTIIPSLKMWLDDTFSFIMESQHILYPWALGTWSTPISLALKRTPSPWKREAVGGNVAP